MIERRTGKQTQVDRILKTSTRRPADYQNLERASCHKPHTAASIAVLTIFGFIYACEQSFSHLKNITNNLQSHLKEDNAFMKFNPTTKP